MSRSGVREVICEEAPEWLRVGNDRHRRYLGKRLRQLTDPLRMDAIIISQ